MVQFKIIALLGGDSRLDRSKVTSTRKGKSQNLVKVGIENER